MTLRSLGRTARILTASLAAAALAAPLSAQTLQLTDGAATMLRGGSYASTNFSRERLLATRASSDGSYVRRVLLKFDTHNTIPAGTPIASATLTLTVAGGNAQTRTLAAYRVTKSYDESAATWNRRKSSLNWSNAGGDTAERVATASVTATAGSRVTYDVTAMVRAIVAGTYGSSRYARFIIADTGSSSRDSYKEFHSDDATDVRVRPTLTVALGSSSTSSPTPAPSPEPTPEPVPSTSSSTLKVLHWNIHHGVGQDGRYDLQRFVTWINRWRPDVISLNEVEKNTGWGNEDQPRRFRDLIQAATGQTWYYHFAQRYGNWSSNGQGNLILSRYPFASTGRETISYGRSVAIATVVVNGRNVTVMSTHLDADSNSRRETQGRELRALASGWGEPRMIAGDFNAWPDHTSYDNMVDHYYDSWAVAAAAGTASSFSGNSPFGATKNGRIDYIFHSRGSSALRVTRSQVPDTRDSSGRMPSDHRPLLTTYEVR